MSNNKFPISFQNAKLSEILAYIKVPEPLLVSQTEMESSDYPARNTYKWSVWMCYEGKSYCISTIKDVDYTGDPRFVAILEF